MKRIPIQDPATEHATVPQDTPRHPAINPQSSTPSRRSPLTRATLTALATVLATGCSMLTYTGPTGEKFMRGSLGAKTQISNLSVETGTNGVRKLHVEGLSNDTSQALGAVTEAAVKAALSTVIPTAAPLPVIPVPTPAPAQLTTNAP